VNESGVPALPPATERGSYAIWTYDRLRYGDTDRQGHVNNAVFATFCESGRVMFLYDEKLALAGPDANFVVVRLEIDFRSEHNFYAARTRDISVGGVFIDTDIALPLGTRLEADLKVLENRIRAEAEVTSRQVIRLPVEAAVISRPVIPPQAEAAASDPAPRPRAVPTTQHGGSHPR